MPNKPYQFYAIKSISNRNLTKKDYEDLVKEVDIISGLDHPNIIKFYETYHDEYFFHIVMELCKGKEVYSKIAENGFVPENIVVGNGAAELISSLVVVDNQSLAFFRHSISFSMKI